MDKYTLPVCVPVFSDRVEIPKIYEAVLPEYCQNIQRILKTEAVASVENTEYTDGLLRICIKANVHVLYVSEPKGLQKSVAFPFEFEHTFDASRIDASGSELTSEAIVYIIATSAKPKSPRSMEIKMNAAVSACIYDCSEISFASPESNPDTELYIKSCTATKHIKVSERPEKLHEDITLDPQMPAIAEISDYSCQIVLDSVKPSDGCLNFNGKAILKCTYRAESNPDESNAEYIYLTKEIPVNGEIHSESITALDTSTGRLAITELSVDSSFDPYGENRIINAVIGYEAAFDVFSQTETEYADDGYCISYACNFVRNSYISDIMCGKISDKTEVKEKISNERTHLAQITDSGMELNITGTDITDGKLFASGKANVWISGCDDKGEPDCLQTAFNVHFPIESVNDAMPDKKYIVNSQVISSTASLRDGELTVSATVETDGVVLEKQKIEAISCANISYDSPKPICNSEYIIYYPEANERMWDIAKKYEISQKELAEANGISADGICNKKTVIIPCRN